MLVCFINDPFQALAISIAPAYGCGPENAVPGSGIKNERTAKAFHLNAVTILLLKLTDYAPRCQFSCPEMQIDKHTGSQQVKYDRPGNIVT
jgi:hypothetical protein